MSATIPLFLARATPRDIPIACCLGMETQSSQAGKNPEVIGMDSHAIVICSVLCQIYQCSFDSCFAISRPRGTRLPRFLHLHLYPGEAHPLVVLHHPVGVVAVAARKWQSLLFA